ncbi:NAD(P)/FAD-dependent oxidoreductase [soil metagenome]
MPTDGSFDAVVVGAGPNGLAAAITIAAAGRRVLVLEAAAEVGGAARSAELTLPGFIHDVGSAVHPLGLASPFFRGLPLDRHGLHWVHPRVPLAHPLDDGSAVVLHRSLERTAVELGRDGAAYRWLLEPLVHAWEAVLDTFLGPFRLPRHPWIMARFGSRALAPAYGAARLLFRGHRARALIGGLAAHAIQPLERPATLAFALMLATLGHAVGWPSPRGGARAIPEALRAHLLDLGGEIRTAAPVRSLAEIPTTGPVLFDLAPRGVLAIAGDRFPDRYRRALERYRHGPGVYKLDLALDAPIPWTAAACREAGTVHVGGTLDEVATAERAVWRGEHPARPFVLVAQPTLADPTRAPEGKHVAWAYCHVPNGSERDMRGSIEGQIERFAPGFRDTIRAAHTMHAQQIERFDPNFVGGDIATGVQDLGQLFTRPVARRDPYGTPDGRLFICSAATPPGGGVHGMAGYFAARSALRAMDRAGPRRPGTW